MVHTLTKGLVAFVAMIGLSLSGALYAAQSAQADGHGYYRYSQKPINVRSGHGKGYGVKYKVHGCKKLFVVKKKGNWRRVKFDGKAGWVHRGVLRGKSHCFNAKGKKHKVKKHKGKKHKITKKKVKKNVKRKLKKKNRKGHKNRKK